MSDQNRIRLIATQPIRGNILDKNGNILVNSKLNYSLIIKPQFVEKASWFSTRDQLVDILNLNPHELQQRYELGQSQQKYAIKLTLYSAG